MSTCEECGLPYLSCTRCERPYYSRRHSPGLCKTCGLLQAVGASTDSSIQRLHDALDDVVDEWGDELKERVDDVNDGSWPNQTREELVQETLKSVESFIEGKLSGVDPRTLPQGIEILPTFGLLQLGASPDWTCIVLLRAFLNDLERMQRRLVTVPAMILSARIPPEVRTYTVQATRCYFLGLFQAATVLARAALERALAD